MPEISTMEPLFCVRQLVEKYKEKKKKLYMVFIDLEKMYDSVLREILKRELMRKGVPKKCCWIKCLVFCAIRKF